jgi:3-deoxy-7-phosphoheptulonate synthase
MNDIDSPFHDREVGSRDSTLDTTRIDDVRIGAVRPLITPALLQERVPVRDNTLALVESSRAASSLGRVRSTTTTRRSNTERA